MKWKYSDTMAAWAVVLILVALIAGVPWDRLGDSAPAGVIDPAQQRFVLEPVDPPPTRQEALHHEDSRFSAFTPEGL